METTQLGRTGLVVSRLGFGGAPAGLANYLSAYDPKVSDQRDEVIAALQLAVKLGINYFDTAADYGAGTSERIFGEALDGLTEEIVLATKLSTRSPVRESVENSLVNLRRDSLDLVQIHGTVISPQQADEILASNGVVDELIRLRDEGLIRHIGFTSEANNEAVYRFIADGRFETMQITYNLLYQHAYEPTRPFGSILEAEKQQMGVLTMRSLTSGVLQRWVNLVNPQNEYDYTADLLQFVLSNPFVDIALVGMRTTEEVQTNVAISENLDRRIDIDLLHSRYVS